MGNSKLSPTDLVSSQIWMDDILTHEVEYHEVPETGKNGQKDGFFGFTVLGTQDEFGGAIGIQSNQNYAPCSWPKSAQNIALKMAYNGRFFHVGLLLTALNAMHRCRNQHNKGVQKDHHVPWDSAKIFSNHF